MRIGSLFAGYGGLDMAVEQVFPDATPAWFCEWDEAPSKVLAHHWPGVPNYRDVSLVDWEAVEPVDIIAGGFPCQDVSHAGRRQGLIRDGDGKTRSGLWGEMLKAIDTIRPSFVVAENVRGLLSAEADSDVEPCPFCMGDGGASPMRALGAVLADLADIGYDAAWCGLRAADVGAAHGRFRVFILAWPTADAPGGYIDHGERREASTASNCNFDGALTLLPTPLANDFSDDISTLEERQARGYGNHLRDLPLMLPGAGSLLPTPAVNDMGASYTPDEWDAWTDRMKAAHGNGNGHGKSLSIEAQRLLPVPQARDYKDHQVQVAGHRPEDKGSINRAIAHLLPTPEASRAGGTAEMHRERKRRSMGRVDPTCTNLDLLVADDELAWGNYAPAIARWESVIGRPAPAPTEPGAKGNPRLSPRFVEWLMGLPDGHVTDQAIGLTRNQQLKALGNGVVPLQGAAALEWLLSVEAVTA